MAKPAANHTSGTSPQVDTQAPSARWPRGATVAQPPVSLLLLLDSEAGSRPNAESHPFSWGHLGICLSPNPELILQCLLPTETLLGKLRRHEVLSLLRESGRNSPKLRSRAETRLPQRKRALTCVPCLEATGPISTSMLLAQRCLDKDCCMDRC